MLIYYNDYQDPIGFRAYTLNSKKQKIAQNRGSGSESKFSYSVVSSSHSRTSIIKKSTADIMFDTLQHNRKKLPGTFETAALCQIEVAIYSSNFHVHLTKTHLAFLFFIFRHIRDLAKSEEHIARVF